MTDPAKIPIPDTLPLLVLSGSILFPHERLTLELKEEEEIAVADAALSAERFLAVFPTANGGDAAGRGTAARIEQMRRREDGAIWLSLAGVARIDRIAPVEGEPVPVHSIRPAPIREGHELRIEALRRNCLEMFEEIIRGSSSYADDLVDVAHRVTTAGHLADLIVSHLRLSYDEKLAFLNEVDVELRLEALGRLLSRREKSPPSKTGSRSGSSPPSTTGRRSSFSGSRSTRSDRSWAKRTSGRSASARWTGGSPR